MSHHSRSSRCHTLHCLNRLRCQRRARLLERRAGTMMPSGRRFRRTSAMRRACRTQRRRGCSLPQPGVLHSPACCGCYVARECTETGTASSGTDSAALVRCSHGVLSTIGSSGAWASYPVGTVCEFAARQTPAQGCWFGEAQESSTLSCTCALRSLQSNLRLCCVRWLAGR